MKELSKIHKRMLLMTAISEEYKIVSNNEKRDNWKEYKSITLENTRPKNVCRKHCCVGEVLSTSDIIQSGIIQLHEHSLTC